MVALGKTKSFPGTMISASLRISRCDDARFTTGHRTMQNIVAQLDIDAHSLKERTSHSLIVNEMSPSP